GPRSANYDGWFGFDSIPVLNKSNPAVQAYFIGADDSVTTEWLDEGADAWRLDVMGDASFPDGYWESFRANAKAEKSDALIIGELWQKDSTLLRFLRGDRADTTMNYRLRDAVLGFLAPQGFDAKGFGDSGRQITAAEFLSRLASIREDYPDAAYFSLMNLLDSHDTERLLWTLTPGAETRAEREFNAANLAAGKRAVRLAALIQYTLPGAPTVFYGDEVGLTGDDDPDDRRTYPWLDKGGQPDQALFAHYQALARLRRTYPVLVNGSFRTLAAAGADVAAYGRLAGNQAAVIVVNRGAAAQSLALPVAGFLPEGVALNAVYTVGSGDSAFTVAAGQLSGALGAHSALVLITAAGADLTPPAAPAGLQAADGDSTVSLTWNAVAGAAGYNVYRSPVSGGGFVKLNASPVTALSFADSGLENARLYFYSVRALDTAGNESGASNEVAALPHLTIGWANLQWPPTMNHTISAVNRTETAYGQVWIDGATNAPGATPALHAQLGFGPQGSQPAGSSAWTWVDAAFNVNAGNNDEFAASLLPESAGVFDYVYRYSTTGGRDWLYADLSGPIASGALPSNPGTLTVFTSADSTAPAAPANLRVTSASPVGISLAWDAVAGDASLYGYEVLRGAAAGGPYTFIARVTDTAYTDSSVIQDGAYFYVVRSLDLSFNRSANSAEAQAVAAARTVTLIVNVTVPATTDGAAGAVHIAGFLDRLDGGLPQWDPGGVSLTRVDATHWAITLTGKEYTQIEYKYALGAWDYVEKDSVCGETANRQLTLNYGAAGTQTVNDTVANWRNVAPCGN
ncbi:MAG: hypothetical protein KA764_22205, partial [Anaerolineales bacterium]|nr:hypothetical protein [Anaerolineales bacterium]